MKGHSESERNATSGLKGVAVAQMGYSDRLLGPKGRPTPYGVNVIQEAAAVPAYSSS